jgi:hypothetical protein
MVRDVADDDEFWDRADVRAIFARIDSPSGLEAFQRQVAASGNCVHPVRLAGRVTSFDGESGERVGSFDTRELPDEVLLKACGNRRATRCPPCSHVYKEDARHLVMAGLQGGKGVPESVVEHPAVFVTFTGPSFGPVHASPAGGRVCRPAPPSQRCPHGRPLSCFARHEKDDPDLGEPLCSGCYRYEHHVIWNALAPELWRRTTIYLFRELAKFAGTTPAALKREVRLAFVRVAEFQRRGLVHLHVVVRADGPEGPGSSPPVWLSPALLVPAVRAAVAAVAVPFPVRLGERIGPKARWGSLVDVSVLSGPDASRRAARYVAKYLQKATDSAGVLDRRVRAGDLDQLAARGLSAHETALVQTAWRLGGRKELAELHLRHWAHQLGYRGHCISKSRRYSTTFGALRAARAEFEASRRAGGREQPNVVRHASWTYRGSGHKTPGDAYLARLWAEQAAENRWLAWMAYDDERWDQANGIYIPSYDDDPDEPPEHLLAARLAG